MIWIRNITLFSGSGAGNHEKGTLKPHISLNLWQEKRILIEAVRNQRSKNLNRILLIRDAFASLKSSDPR